MRRLLLVVMLCVGLQQAFGWGNEGHKAINKVAASRIPQSMPAFLQKASARLEYLGPEPDRWRNKEEFSVKNAQEPDHFIDMERVDWLADLPQGRYNFYKALYEKRAALIAANGAAPATDNRAGKGGASGASAAANALRPDDLLPDKVGLQPYITMEVYDRLKVAFREYRHLTAAKENTEAVEQDIVFYMGWMGHYVGDGSNPLHTTVKYNGWVGENPNKYTTEHKIHWMMEGPFVGDNLAQMPLADLVKAPVKLDNAWQDYQKYLRDSNTHVEQCYQLEKAGGFIGAGSDQSREFIRQRLAAGAQMLVNMWYTAWVDSEKEPERPKFD